jgi:hypothetical protein
MTPAMSRQQVRSMKCAVQRAVSSPSSTAEKAGGQDCALALLQRSIEFGHGRLSVLRLALAVRAGASVPSEHWNYCREIIERADDQTLRETFQMAISVAQRQP